MTVRGIEAIKLYLPPAKDKIINTSVREEKGIEVFTPTTITAKANAAISSSTSMTSVERYRQEWADLLTESLEAISRKAFVGDLRITKFRSVYWAILLRVLNGDYKNWHSQRQQQRQRYERLQQEFIKNPHELTAPDDDPLSQSTKSVWNQYFSDQELFGVIRQDVVRTFPGVDFFRKPIIQNCMINILFYYAREHPYMCYRQGMHEILAPIIFVIYGDHQSFIHFKEISKADVDETLLDVLNPDYLEADSYSMFSRLMSSVESYYRVTNLVQTETGRFKPSSETSNETSTEVEVIEQLNSIRDKILAKEDLHLHNYLLKLEIPLHIFGIRWLRLLFGREFALLDLLVLWDAIFADSDHFDLPNYILVAMLIRIRDKLLLSDYTTALTYLMRYPSNVDVNLVLRHALHMLMPKIFDRPPNAFVFFTPSNNSRIEEKRKNSQPTISTTSLLQQRQRTSSISDEQFEKQIKMLQIQNAAEYAESRQGTTDGYSKNSPELMQLELRNAQTVITIARQKLLSYLATVRKHTAKNSTEQLTQALDGIEELCTLLDVKFMFPLHSRTAPIDHAFEAEVMVEKINDIEKSKGFTLDTATDMSTLNSLTSSSLGAAVAATNSSTTTAYEKPDNGFMVNTQRLLGGTKDIELISIATTEMGILNEEITDRRKSQHFGLPAADPLNPHDD